MQAAFEGANPDDAMLAMSVALMGGMVDPDAIANN
jgi:hypothetical protein